MVDKYKDIAEYLDLMTDKALALLGSLGAMIACGCKLQFGYMNDLYGFKKVYSLVIVLILGSGVGINFGTSNPFVYGFYVCMSYSNLGAHYTILAPVCRRLYSNTTGMKVWGILYSSIGFGSLIAFCVQGDCRHRADCLLGEVEEGVVHYSPPVEEGVVHYSPVST